MVLLRLSFSTALLLLALITLPPSRASAEPGDEEQPGMVPNRADEQLDPSLRRQLVFFRSNEPPGTIIVHTSERFLYVVLGGGRAVRYGIGVGRAGFQWQGLLKISRKQEWPDWTPPDEISSGNRISRAGWLVDPETRWARVLSISGTPSIEYTGRTNRTPSALPCHRVASGW